MTMNEPPGYPIITRDNALKLGTRYQKQVAESATKLRKLAPLEDEESYVQTRVLGNYRFDYEVLEGIAHRFFVDTIGLSKMSDKQEMFASTAREIIDSYPPLVVQDLDFWRYLGLVTFRDYVFEINGRMQPGDYGGLDSQIDRWELIEGLRWAFRLAKEPNDEYLSLIREASELAGRTSNVRESYISNIIRPSWAKHQPAARAFIEVALEGEPLFDDFSKGSTKLDRKMNLFQQRVGESQNNVLLPYLDQDEAAVLFRTLK